ncbi:hypothetical protein HCAG_09264, partial [Histoplasma mississippiense (nom. inval.)]|uniref:hypothetical protein n=1 Tax=Ajellomyces capsulatus (strain NAm1 / WU24) TaxID=2059318 RepID=UPI000157D65D
DLTPVTPATSFSSADPLTQLLLQVLRACSSRPVGQHILNMGDVFVKRIRIDYDIVKISHAIYVQNITEGFVDIRLESRRGVGAADTDS